MAKKVLVQRFHRKLTTDRKVYFRCGKFQCNGAMNYDERDDVFYVTRQHRHKTHIPNTRRSKEIEALLQSCVLDREDSSMQHEDLMRLLERPEIKEICVGNETKYSLEEGQVKRSSTKEMVVSVVTQDNSGGRTIRKRRCAHLKELETVEDPDLYINSPKSSNID
jgi:hypothetical protein